MIDQKLEPPLVADIFYKKAEKIYHDSTGELPGQIALGLIFNMASALSDLAKERDDFNKTNLEIKKLFLEETTRLRNERQKLEAKLEVAQAKIAALKGKLLK